MNWLWRWVWRGDVLWTSVFIAFLISSFIFGVILGRAS